MRVSAGNVSTKLSLITLAALGLAAAVPAESSIGSGNRLRFAQAGDAPNGGVMKTPLPADPGPTAAPPARPERDWPMTLPDAKADAAGDADSWPPDEIIRAQAHCAHVLRSIDAVVIPVDPIKQGECGAAAPVQLVSVGRNPEVTFSPPPTVTCDMAATVAEWVADLQPLARKHLGGPIVRIETISSYSCRNAYNRKRTRLSEHGRANALDLRRFTTNTGKDAVLLTHWGLTERDLRAIAEAEAKAAAEKAAAEKAPAEKVAQDKATEKAAPGKPAGGQDVASVPQRQEPVGEAGTQQVAAVQPADRAKVATSGLRTGTLMEGLPPGKRILPRPVREADSANLTPNRLGGPQATAAPKPPPLRLIEAEFERQSAFLKAAHVAACRRFGTVLGPEANDAHRDHFHLDMAERTRGNFCE